MVFYSTVGSVPYIDLLYLEICVDCYFCDNLEPLTVSHLFS
jgi:hypothetical protein